MKITALVENESSCELTATHGLSLYIETEGRKILFDLGPDDTLFENSRKRGVDLAGVDTVIISHGHRDHGGALARFLTINRTAKIYAQRSAFNKHYSVAVSPKLDIGLDSGLMAHPQMVLLDGDRRLGDALLLFTVTGERKCASPINDVLYTEYGPDDFAHEQSLLILGASNVLIMGCGHTGVVSIMEKAADYKPRVCLGGYHLQNPDTNETASEELLDSIAGELSRYDTRFYTCHCTGQKAYGYLSRKLGSIHYLACGDVLEI